MILAQVEVELGDQGAVVVRARDRAELVVEQPRPLRLQVVVQLLQLGGVTHVAGELLRLLALLLVVREEKEGLVPDDRAAERESELMSRQVRLAAAPGGRELGDEAVELAEIVGGPFELVRSRLRDHGHEAAGGPAELGRGALAHDNELLDRILVEGEGRTLTSPLLSEEGVVEVGAVHHDVVEDAPLAADVQHFAVGPLSDLDAGRQKRVVQVVAAVVRQSVDHFLREALRLAGVLCVDEGLALRFDDEALQLDRFEPDVQRDGLTDSQRDALDRLVRRTRRSLEP